MTRSTLTMLGLLGNYRGLYETQNGRCVVVAEKDEREYSWAPQESVSISDYYVESFT